MNTITPLDLDTWARREHFEHYFRTSRCTFAVTVDVDVTELVSKLRDSRRKTYLAQVWALATIVNRYAPLRMAVDEGGAPGIWDVLHPLFTVLNPERETFAAVWAPYDPDFAAFHDAAAPILAEHRHAIRMFPQDDAPPNTFDVSSLPWTSFTGFTLHIERGWDHLLPIFTVGRHDERDGRTFMPLAVQVHHASADGFHVARAVADLEQLFAEPAWLD